MKGHKRWRGSSWEFSVFLGTDPLTGKKQYRYSTFHERSARKADQALAAFVTETLQRRPSASKPGTVSDLLERWLEMRAGDFSPTTTLETTGYINRTINPSIGTMPLQKVSTDVLDRFYVHLRDGKGPGNRPLAPATIRRIHAILRPALQQAVRWGWIDRNPAADASPPRGAGVPRQAVDPTDVPRLVAESYNESEAFGALVRLAAVTGARRGELLGLRWTHVDPDKMELTVERAVVVGCDGITDKSTKTGKPRCIAIDPGTCDALQRLRVVVDLLAVECGTWLPDDAYVFSSSPDGMTPWRPDTVSRTFRRVAKRAGVQGAVLHGLRHGAATYLLTEGIDVRTTAGRLGHRNTATTLNTYAHFMAAPDRIAADTIAKLIDGNRSVDI